ncbi:MAG: DUF6029 family protein [candidate division KSB1 bacterium]|nr:DUF6029 family protein [candidate division KSB1 bacterium]MDZ7275413.1 DUF6029 family protein [candidate division KSB1 bacterium]MDZ7286275.1 DUF6029 family protein [candidate division KSB1 bacterium]MDZ7296501.1 DUF6029 family protein [candidate division KSB1 bacterium]MDZ7305541.1 DUF6029 family protein [candidate division KSB1 bacterium]
MHLIITCLILLSLLPAAAARAQLEISGNNQLEYARNASADVRLQSRGRRDFFENWMEGNLRYRRFRLGLRLEMHNAPQIYAPDQSIRRAEFGQRFLEYDSGTLTIRAGHNYALLGRGLTLRFFENRQLRYDTRLDGLTLAWRRKNFDLTLLTGQPINRENERQKLFHAGECRLKPLPQVHVGMTGVTTRPANGRRVSWGSLFSEINLARGGFYLEYAREDNRNESEPGAALYLNATALLGALSLTAEYKDYDRFEQFEGAYFNNPPLVAREHLYTLLNRHQLVQNANDETGYAVEAAWPVIMDGVLTAHYSRTANHRRERLYEEFYGQFEWHTPSAWELFGAAGRQQDAAARHLNLAGSATIAVSDFHALKAVVEHQHTRRLLNDQQFYSQAVTLGLSHAPDWAIALLGERTTEQDLRRRLWLALQLDVNFWKNCDLSLVAGSRRKGKICVGGVCVIKPELEGVELTLITRF